jgi:CheY-like chemotaxis protein
MLDEPDADQPAQPPSMQRPSMQPLSMQPSSMQPSSMQPPSSALIAEEASADEGGRRRSASAQAEANLEPQPAVISEAAPPQALMREAMTRQGMAVEASSRVGVTDAGGAIKVQPPKRRVVMVVDDDDAIREALEDVLSDEGYDVIGASDGQQALEYLNADDLNGERRPQAILVDLWMPVMDGWKLVDVLSADARFSRIPLVVLTAARDTRARELSVAEVLTKPVQLHQVLGVLERLTVLS